MSVDFTWLIVLVMIIGLAATKLLGLF